jgi:hypothetical protein
LQRLAKALDIAYTDLFALTGYQVPEALPSLTPYLRSRYPNLSEVQAQQVQRFFDKVRGRTDSAGKDQAA